MDNQTKQQEKIKIAEYKINHLVFKLLINSTFENKLEQIKDWLLEDFHKVIIMNDSLWLFKQVTGLEDKKRKAATEKEQQFILRKLKSKIENLGFKEDVISYFSFGKIEERVLKPDPNNAFDNAGLEVEPVFEDIVIKETLADKVERILTAFLAGGGVLINSSRDVFKVDSALKTVFINDKATGLELFKQVLEAGEIEVANADLQFEKAKLLDQNRASGSLQYLFTLAGIAESLEVLKKTEIIKQFFQEQLGCFKDAITEENYVQLWKGTASAQYVHATLQDTLVYKIKSMMENAGFDVNREDIKTTLLDDTIYKIDNAVELEIKRLGLSWDGKDWFAELYNCIEVKPPQKQFFEKFFKVWYVSMVKQYFNFDNINECRNNFMFITVSTEGGAGKGYLAEQLVPKRLFPLCSPNPYFDVEGEINPQDGQQWQQGLGKIFGYCEEFSIDNQKANDKLKKMVTNGSFTYKPHYVNSVSKRKTFSLWADSNHTQLFFDPTGNRRFIVVEFLNILRTLKQQVNFEQLFLQAKHEAENNWLQYQYSDALKKEVVANAMQYCGGQIEKSYVIDHFEKDATGRMSIGKVLAHLQSKGVFNINKKLFMKVLEPYKRATLWNGNTVYELKEI
jgi:Virulence-associated protein E